MPLLVVESDRSLAVEVIGSPVLVLTLEVPSGDDFVVGRCKLLFDGISVLASIGRFVETAEGDPVRDKPPRDFDPLPDDRVFEIWVEEGDWLLSPLEGSTVTVLCRLGEKPDEKEESPDWAPGSPGRTVELVPEGLTVVVSLWVPVVDLEVPVWPVASPEDMAVQEECVGSGIETDSLVMIDLLLFDLYDAIAVSVSELVPGWLGIAVTVTTGWGDWGSETVADLDE